MPFARRCDVSTVTVRTPHAALISAAPGVAASSAPPHCTTPLTTLTIAARLPSGHAGRDTMNSVCHTLSPAQRIAYRGEVSAHVLHDKSMRSTTPRYPAELAAAWPTNNEQSARITFPPTSRGKAPRFHAHRGPQLYDYEYMPPTSAASLRPPTGHRI